MFDGGFDGVVCESWWFEVVEGVVVGFVDRCMGGWDDYGFFYGNVFVVVGRSWEGVFGELFGLFYWMFGWKFWRLISKGVVWFWVGFLFLFFLM